jgi:hypothetical protein
MTSPCRLAGRELPSHQLGQGAVSGFLERSRRPEYPQPPDEHVLRQHAHGRCPVLFRRRLRAVPGREHEPGHLSNAGINQRRPARRRPRVGKPNLVERNSFISDFGPLPFCRRCCWPCWGCRAPRNENKPTPGALVILHPLNDPDPRAPRPVARVGADGRFSPTTYSADDGAPAGEYAVTVAWVKETDNQRKWDYQKAPLRDTKTLVEKRVAGRTDQQATSSGD